jgi:nitrile hydratase accessory protein
LNRPDAPSQFEEPWQAEAFALAVNLVETGVFSWSEWTATFSGRLAEAQGETPLDPQAYHRAWVAALEDLIEARGVLRPDALLERRAAWREAYLHTPHGQPVQLTVPRP